MYVSERACFTAVLNVVSGCFAWLIWNAKVHRHRHFFVFFFCFVANLLSKTPDKENITRAFKWKKGFAAAATAAAAYNVYVKSINQWRCVYRILHTCTQIESDSEITVAAAFTRNTPNDDGSTSMDWHPHNRISRVINTFLSLLFSSSSSSNYCCSYGRIAFVWIDLKSDVCVCGSSIPRRTELFKNSILEWMCARSSIGLICENRRRKYI